MSRYNRIFFLLLFAILIANCKSPLNGAQKPATTKPGAAASKTSSIVDEDSLPIEENELKEITEAAAQPNADAEQELGFIRRFKIGQSLDEVRKNAPEAVKLGNPTTQVPVGELPEDEVVVEFKGNVSGYFHFNGNPQAVGKLIMVEAFTDDRSYKNNKQRIRSFIKLLGRPAMVRKDEEDTEGTPLYSVDWREGNQLILYQDEAQWGYTISLTPSY
jgi:hypothetical protein